MADPLVLSGSSINTYLRCARQWEYGYVQRIKRPPRLKMVLGTAGHTAVEQDLIHKMETGEDLPREQVQETFRDEFVELAKETDDDTDDVGKLTDSGIKTVGVWHDVVAPKTFPMMIEQHLQYKLNGTIIDGTIDVVHQDGRIGDWKFTGKTPDKRGGDYLLNMVGYAIGYRRMTGKVETGVVLDFMVRLKQPKHFPIASGTVPDESIVAYAGIVDDVVRAINAGLFPPTGLKSGACSWCGYRDICSAYAASSNVR
jgi:hypothetical protein